MVIIALVGFIGLAVAGYLVYAYSVKPSQSSSKHTQKQITSSSKSSSSSSTTSAQEKQDYAIKDIGVHFSYPANWSASTGAEGRSVELGLSDSQARYIHITYSVTSVYSLQEIMSSIEQNRQTENSDYQRIGSTETIIDNHPALRYECEYNRTETGKAPVLYKETDHIMIKDDTMIILSLAAPVGDYEALLPGFNDLVSGFKLS